MKIICKLGSNRKPTWTKICRNMGEYLKVYLSIICEVSDERACNQVIDSMQSRIGIINSKHVLGTNVITVSAEWNESDFDQKIREIHEIRNVRNLIVDQKNTLITRNIIEPNVEIFDSVSWQIEKDPIAEIGRAMDVGDYYKSISLACTMFQHYGREILINKYAVSKKALEDLNDIINILYGRNIIDKTINDNIHDARKLRNELQHKDRSIKYTSDQALAASNIVENALTGLKFLKTEYEKI